jgi:hypothetical protein
MNKGLQLASGEWINFMNSGDKFFDSNVLSNVFTNFLFQKTDVIYGNWKVFYPASGLFQSRIAPSKLDLNFGSQFCHQASFIRTEIHQENGYNQNDPIAADFRFFFSLWKKGSIFTKVNQDVCVIEAGGVSDLKREKVVRSWKAVVNPIKAKYRVYFFYLLWREISVSAFKKNLTWPS